MIIYGAGENVLEGGGPLKARIVQRFKSTTFCCAGVELKVARQSDLPGDLFDFCVDEHVFRHLGAFAVDTVASQSIPDALAGRFVKVETVSARCQDPIDLVQGPSMGHKVMRCGKAENTIQGIVGFRDVVALACIAIIDTGIKDALPFWDRSYCMGTNVTGNYMRVEDVSLYDAGCPALTRSYLEDPIGTGKGIDVGAQAVKKNPLVPGFINDILDRVAFRTFFLRLFPESNLDIFLFIYVHFTVI